MSDSNNAHRGGLDLAGLKAEYGDDGFIAEMLRLFAVDAPAAMDRLDAAIAAGDTAEGRRAAHSLCNIVGVIRCPETLEAVRRMQEALRVGDRTAAPGLAAELRRQIDGLVSEVRIACP